MREAFEIVIEDIILYNNKQYLIILFLIALLFLWFTEKDKRIRITFLYLVTALAVLFLCPVYAAIAMKFDADIYYRVFWALPAGILVCYSAVKVIMHFHRVWQRVLCGIIVVLIIFLNGKFVYTNTLHDNSVNAYHMPQVVIDVADAIRLQNYKPKAVLPAELLPFIRQYTAEIYMPYGRNIVETQWNFSSNLYDVMEAEVYDAKQIAKYAREEACVYVVLSSIKEIKGSMEEQNYFLKDFVGGYYIYVDYYYYEVLKEQNLWDEE